MVFKHIKLYKYKRFTMHAEDTFELGLESFLILTWKNGYGKSSLLYQINVLPIEKKDFEEGGYKEVTLIHNNKEYVIKSGTDGHSLKEDGVELNVSLNKKTYLEIVKDKFKMSNAVLNYVNGYQTLTRMSANERKDVLFSISNLDYSYALDLFAKVCEQHRDSLALLKYNAGKLNNIIELSKEVDVSELNKKIENLDQLKTYFLQGYRQDVNVKDTELKEELDRLYGLYSRLQQHNDTVNMEELNKSIAEKEAKVKYLDEKLKDNQKQHEMLLTTVDKSAIHQLNQDILTLNQEENTIISNLPNPYILELWNMKHPKWNNLTYHLSQVLGLLKMEYEELGEIDTEKIQIEYKQLLDQIQQEYKVMNHLKQILDSSGNLDAVKCDHCGNKIDMKEKQNKLKHSIGEIEVKIAKLEDEIKTKEDLNKSIEKNKDYLHKLNLALKEVSYNQYQHLTLSQHQELYLEYDRVLQSVDKINTIALKMNKLKEEHARLSKSLSMDKTDLDKAITKNRNDFDQIQQERSPLIKELTLLIEKRNHLLVLEENKAKLKKSYLRVSELHELLRIQDLNKFIMESVELINTELKELLEKKRQTENLETERRRLVDEVAKIKEDIDDYKYLIEKLSPKNGLIAKSINSFIGVIIMEMNHIINNVWSYPLKILPCSVDDGNNLDFKFKVKVNDERIVDDVKDMSSSMMEIVNLAFRLIYIKYMDFGDIPLVLDEFGSTMDKEHATKAFDMIEDVLRNSFEQIFLVSHFDSMYGRFKNVSIPQVG